ncbi:MAG: endonuclease [Alphaproteobacteria bacterium]|nr:endonuclease [Alphaproteobacteria bacterium]
MKYNILNIIIFILLFPAGLLAGGNTFNNSYQAAKQWLERDVYRDNRTTLYCQAAFDNQKNVIPPAGFDGSLYPDRAQRIEWEHVVPAENFGRSFPEWREGSPECADKGKPYKGRKCAEKTSTAYQYMQSDMYNLYPAVGSVNAARSNYNFALLGADVPSAFGACSFKIEDNKAEPPPPSRGKIARAYLYMEAAYPAYRMSASQRNLMQAWDRQHPVDRAECLRTRRIEEIQHNDHPIIKPACQAAGLW